MLDWKNGLRFLREEMLPCALSENIVYQMLDGRRGLYYHRSLSIIRLRAVDTKGTWGQNCGLWGLLVHALPKRHAPSEAV